jgi:hypothetical protein
MRFAIIVVPDLPGPRSRIWGSDFENETFGSGVPQRTAVRLEDGWNWGLGRVSANAPSPWRAWSLPVGAITRLGRIQLKVLVDAALARVFIEDVDEDEWQSFDRRESWRARAGWVRPAVSMPRAKRGSTVRRGVARSKAKKRA